ncbi:MAG: creatininase family protein [Eubacteriales bacterium]|nr:creatininase family protein [Eubacteriales bacterium]
MRLETLCWPDAEAVLARDPVVILPMGTLEVHGRHLPLNTDMLAPDRVVTLIEQKRPEVLILPSLPVGECDSQTEFPGTISLGPELLYEVLHRIFFSLYRHGARRFIALNGHGPNVRPLDRVGLDLARAGARLAELNWWRYVWDLNPAWKGGHGGGQETAAILAIDSSLVNKQNYEAAKMEGLSPEFPASGWDTVAFRGVNVPVPRPDIRVTDNGWLGGDPLETATAEWGETMLAAAADWAADFIDAYQKISLEA